MSSKLFFFLVAFCALLLASEDSDAQVIQYEINGTLSDGGVFDGVFGIELTATDTFASLTSGGFDLVNVDLSLTNTALFASPSTAGLADSGVLFQSNGEQELLFNFTSDDQLSGAFTDSLAFGPFNGDVNIASAIEGSYLGQGFIDGAGGSDIVSVTLNQVPEPSATMMLALFAASCAVGRRKR